MTGIIFSPLNKMAHSVHKFDSYEEFSKFVNFYEGKKASETLRHERAHFEKALQLGYKPHYAVHAIFESGGIIPLDYRVDFEGRRPSLGDLLKIALAPKHPSKADRDLARDLRKKLAS